MATDLHIHSCYSSGTQTPEEAIQEAISKGIRFISFTDDDTMDAYHVLEALAQQYGIRYIKGVQVSASRENHLFRLLAYDCDPDNPRLQALFKDNRDNWDAIGLSIIKIMAEERPELSAEEYGNHKQIPHLGGFKFQNYLYAKGLDGGDDASVQWFLKYQAQMGAIMQKLPFRPVEEVIDIIHDAGGYAIIAGGYLRNPDTLTEDVEQLMAMGIDGLEGYSASHSPETAAALRDYAKAHDLLLTGGGDGHGAFANQAKYAIGIAEIEDELLNLGSIKIFGSLT